MNSKSDIRNCTITFQCPKLWRRLTETADPKVRFCDYCYEPVHLVESVAELKEQVAQGHCVALLDLSQEPESPSAYDFVGIIAIDPDEDT